MSYWLKIRRAFLRLLQNILYLWVQTKVLIPPSPALHKNSNENICYALGSKSLADSLVLERECKNLDLYLPFDPLSVPGTFESRALSFAHNQHFNPFKKNAKNRHSDRIKRLLQSVKMHPNLEVKIVPVTIFWGRSPDKEISLWKIMFSDTWSIPSFFKKFFMILLHGRQTCVHFDHPISLRSYVDQNFSENTGEIAEITSLLQTQFRKQREAVIGPDLSHRRLLVQSLLEANPVKEAIKTIAEEKGSEPDKYKRKALKYADEIASDYSYAVIRVYHRVLTWVWNKLYDGVEVHHIEQLQDIAKHNEIIYVPSHRSHIDYLLLSYVLYVNGLVPPHIAAGVNLNLPILGPILRRGGAFFMRRSFRDNPLYAAVFDEYLHTVLSRGFSIEYFIEGGRSRTGRLLSPRTGMLSMTLKSFLRNPNKPIAFVPIYFGYERIFEGTSYIGELKGKKKEKESLGSLIQSFRRIRRQFGKVQVNFASPIYLKDFLDQQSKNWQQLEVNTSEDSLTEIKTIASDLARTINTEINNAAVIHNIALLSIIILSTPKQSIGEKMLGAQIELSLSLLSKLKYSERQIHTSHKAEKIIQYGERMGAIQRKQHTLGDVIFCNEHQAILLSYFKNNTLHVFALPALVALLISNNSGIDKTLVNKVIQTIYPFLRTELFLRWGDPKDLTSTIERTCHFLIENHLISQDTNNGGFHAADPGSEHFVTLNNLASCIRPTLERYYIVLAVLKRFGSGSITVTELEDLGRLMTERMSLLHQFNAPEHYDRKLFRNFLDTLLKAEIVKEGPEDGKLLYEEPLIELIQQAQYVLSTNIRHAILQITEDGSTHLDI